MKYAIMSDIHGNIEALRAVLEDIAAVAPDEVLCLGDIVGYGADPNECVEMTRTAAAVTVAGNHDWAAVGKLGLDYFNSAARIAAEWTGTVLLRENRSFLEGLPLTAKAEESMLLVHSSPAAPEEWNYVFHPGQAAIGFASFAEPLCFIGHTHQPAVFTEGGDLHLGRVLESFRLSKGSRYIVNVGSVGQPRDGNHKAAYCVYDSKDMTLAIRRVEYDVAGAQAKIVKNGLPSSLAERLPLGL